MLIRSVFKRVYAAIFGCVLIVFLAAQAHGATSYISNGSFTGTDYGQVGYDGNTLSGWTNTDNGTNLGYNFLFSSTDFDTSPGVTGDAGALQLWGPANGGATGNNLGPSPDGGNFLGDDGAYEAAAIDATLTGPLISGDEYVLQFYWGGAQQEGVNFTAPTTEQWQVTFGGTTQSTQVLDNAGEGFTGWYSETMVFVANSTSPVLSFLAVGTPGAPSEPPFVLLDGVSLEQAPEPGTFALIGFGLLAAPLLYRLTKSKVGRR